MFSIAEYERRVALLRDQCGRLAHGIAGVVAAGAKTLHEAVDHVEMRADADGVRQRLFAPAGRENGVGVLLGHGRGRVREFFHVA